jgi:hypothetical protein
MAKLLNKIENGIGRVFKEKSEISTVHYELTFFQKKIPSGSFPETFIDGTKGISGYIKPINDSLRWQFDAKLTLVLEDGRKIDFYLANLQTGAIRPTSGLY